MGKNVYSLDEKAQIVPIWYGCPAWKTSMRHASSAMNRRTFLVSAHMLMPDTHSLWNAHRECGQLGGDH